MCLFNIIIYLYYSHTHTYIYIFTYIDFIYLLLQAGGLILDKEIRSLASYLAAATSWSVRDKFARLTQIATILSIEKVEELADYCGADAIAWRLTTTEVRHIASLRIDLKPEDIKRFKI